MTREISKKDFATLSTLPRIGVVHPRLAAGGGSEAVALWILFALQDVAELTLMTSGPVDLVRLNDQYGTRVEASRVRIMSLPLLPGLGSRFAALQSARLARFCRGRSTDFDLMISSYNVCDLGQPGLQFVGDFSFDDDLRRELHHGPGGPRNFLYDRSFLRSAYLRFGRMWSRERDGAWKSNATAANSQWTRKMLRERYGIDSEVAYPPVSAFSGGVPWEEREDGFVCIGRIAPEKRIESLIDILGRVRERGRCLHLHVLGGKGDPSHFRRMKRVFQQNREWVRYEGAVFGEAKREILSRHRYGISGCRYEAFGIAVAEMAKSGLIPWVPRDGGQVEIVEDQALTYENEDEAVLKILRVLGDPGLQMEFRERLLRSTARFSPERFVADVRDLVSRTLDREGRVGGLFFERPGTPSAT